MLKIKKLEICPGCHYPAPLKKKSGLCEECSRLDNGRKQAAKIKAKKKHGRQA